MIATTIVFCERFFLDEISCVHAMRSDDAIEIVRETRCVSLCAHLRASTREIASRRRFDDEIANNSVEKARGTGGSCTT
jgi:hypothetical protein